MIFPPFVFLHVCICRAHCRTRYTQNIFFICVVNAVNIEPCIMTIQNNENIHGELWLYFFSEIVACINNYKKSR